MGLLLADEKAREDHLKCLATYYSKEEFANIKSWLSKKKDKDSLYDTFLKVKQDLSQSQFYKILQDLKSNRSIIARLLEAYIYIKQENATKSKLILKDIISKDYSWYVLFGNRVFLDKEKQTEMITSIFETLKESFEDEKIYQATINYLFYNTSGEISDLLRNKFNELNSLKAIRESYQSVVYSKTFKFVWAPYLFNESSNIEYVDYLLKTLAITKDKIENQDLLLFRDVEIRNKSFKKIVIEKIKKIQSSDNIYDQLIFVKLLDDEVFYNFLISNSDIKIGLLLNLKRKLYLRILRETSAKYYALFNLLLIGDTNINYLKDIYAK